MSKKREFNHLTQQQQQKEESIHILTVLCHLRRHGLPPLYLFLYTTQAQVFSHESSLVCKALNPIPGRVSLNFNPSIHGHGPKRIKSNIIAENKKKMINCGDYLDFLHSNDINKKIACLGATNPCHRKLLIPPTTNVNKYLPAKSLDT